MKFKAGDVLLPKPAKSGCQFDFEILTVKGYNNGEVWVEGDNGRSERHEYGFIERWYDKIDRKTERLFRMLFT